MYFENKSYVRCRFRLFAKTLNIVFYLSLVYFLFVSFVFAAELPETQIIGMCYGPFRDGQNPDSGPHPTIEQIKEDLHIIKYMADYVRIYSMTEHADEMLDYAKKLGLKIALGAWLGSDEASNDLQVEKLISISQNHDNILFVVVGNEAIFRKSKGYPEGVSHLDVIKKISEVKEKVDVPVTTAEPWIVWKEKPSLAQAVDFIFANIHPYWENKKVSNAAWHTYIKLKEVQEMYPDKRVIIGETGWPTGGQPNGPSVPGVREQEKYIREFLDIAEKAGLDFFFFEAFDEEYKKEEPNNVGPYWGLFFSNGESKHTVQTLKKIEPGVLPKRSRP